jgi:hypothetical protein
LSEVLAKKEKKRLRGRSLPRTSPPEPKNGKFNKNISYSPAVDENDGL